MQFSYSLPSRSRQITHENLRQHDPGLVAGVEAWFQQTQPDGRPGGNRPQRPMFTPFRLRGLRLANRVVVSVMCRYSAQGGMPDDWHLKPLGHAGSRGSTRLGRDGRDGPLSQGNWPLIWAWATL